MRSICRILIAATLLTGCATSKKPTVIVDAEHSYEPTLGKTATPQVGEDAISLASFEDEVADDSVAALESKPEDSDSKQDDTETKPDDSKSAAGALQSAAPGKAGDAELHAVQFDEVVSSVYQSYPMLESALLSRNIAWGQRVGASGAFDMKLKGASENGPQGFYQTYRQNIGVVLWIASLSTMRL